jgi:subtilisin family serine protease
MQRPENSLFDRLAARATALRAGERPGPSDGDRPWQYETCEERLAMSAAPAAEFWIDSEELFLESDAGPWVAAEGSEPAYSEQALSAQALATFANFGWSDLSAARSEFGLRGGNQTVAVIDSGIAYDHIALGGGLGKAYRVVGGWDFAENDANPYDDGPAGFHGTHVAGILGASDGTYPGVAPGVDLVALRVFNDQGAGQFSWVESALQWVYDNRSTFDNPITTVNLSLGMDWNSSKLPQWATLEVELKRLDDAGIFISVAAGNSFLVYGKAGLSYPAVSEYVTPVASVDASGALSRFTQRASGVLAAPGERIMSTLPDHFYGGDGIKNDWGATSGTSMAAPYVAGAAVLVREAMEHLGYADIDQSVIYSRLKATADQFFDAVTSTTYHCVNLPRAIESLVGADDFGSTAAAANSIGSLTTSLQVSGTIGRTTDQDFFRFTAAQSGLATLSLAGSEHLGARWIAAAGQGSASGSQLTLSVVAGQTYVVGVAGGGTTIGKFQVGMSLTPVSGGNGGGGSSGGGNSGGGSTGGGSTVPTNPTDWGRVEQMRQVGIDLKSGDQWFEVTAARSGTLTVEALFDQRRGNVDLEVYDSRHQRVAASAGAPSGERIDLSATAGGTYFVRAIGTNRDVDFRLTNLVTTAGQSITIAGTSAADAFTFQAAAGRFTIGGVQYDVGTARNVQFAGGGGYDRVTLVGSSAAETATLRAGSVEMTNGSVRVAATGAESVQVIGGREDTAILHDSAGRDYLTASTMSVVVSGDSFRSAAQGFGSVTIVSQGGGDYGVIRGSGRNDTLSAWGDTRIVRSQGVTIRAENFATLRYSAGSGAPRDLAALATAAAESDDLAAAAIESTAATSEAIAAMLAHVQDEERQAHDQLTLRAFFARLGRE